MKRFLVPDLECLFELVFEEIDNVTHLRFHLLKYSKRASNYVDSGRVIPCFTPEAKLALLAVKTCDFGSE
jgi:hypothetical protein